MKAVADDLDADVHLIRGGVAMRSQTYTVQDLAAAWSCSTGQVYALIRRGELRAFRIGRRRGLRITQGEVDRWEEESAKRLVESEELSSETDTPFSGTSPVGLSRSLIKAAAGG